MNRKSSVRKVSNIRIPLFEAASLGHVQTMRRLCELGANVNPSMGTKSWDTPLWACLEVHYDSFGTHSDIIYETLMTLLEFNYQISPHEFVIFFRNILVDEEAKMVCLKACLDVSLTNTSVAPFFIENDEIEAFLNDLDDDDSSYDNSSDDDSIDEDSIKQAIEGAQRTYYKWKEAQTKQHKLHDCTNEIYSFFTLRDVARSDIAQVKKGLDETFYSMQQRMGI